MSALPPAPATALVDVRNVRAGLPISDDGGYYDGQSLVSTPLMKTWDRTLDTRDDEGDGRLLSLVFHHCHNHEGGPGLRLYHCTSTDSGKTWTKPDDSPVHADLDHPSHDGYQVVHPKNPSIVFCFYGYNKGKLHYEDADGNHVDLPRGDMQLDDGFRLKVSKDGGRTYPNEVTATVPVRRTKIDRENPWGGSTMGAFCCDKPSVIGDSVFFAFQKTREGGGETHFSEVFIMRSKDLLSVKHAEEAEWETLPKGDVGLRWPSAFSLGEEPHVIRVDDKDADKIAVLWRTEVGILAIAYSLDAGETFSEPEAMQYGGPGGERPIKNPRGAITPHRFKDGTVLLIFYNNGHTEKEGYTGRRYYWYTLGRPANSESNPTESMVWSQPELALWYDGEALDDRPDWNADWAIVDGPGYVDFCEHKDSLLFVESNKLTLRLHTVDPRTLYMLRNQHALTAPPADVVPTVHIRGPADNSKHRGPLLCDVQARTSGYTVTLKIRAKADRLKPGQLLVDGRDETVSVLDEVHKGDYVTKGWTVSVEGRGKAGLQLKFWVSDGWRRTEHFTDGVVWDGKYHVISFTVDAGPLIVTSVVDERLCDGGEHFPEGWSSLDTKFGAVGGRTLLVKPSPTVWRPHSGAFPGDISDVMVFTRPLMVTESIALGRGLMGGMDSKL